MGTEGFDLVQEAFWLETGLRENVISVKNKKSLESKIAFLDFKIGEEAVAHSEKFKKLRRRK